MYNYGSILSRYAKLASVGNLLSLALSVTIYVFLAIGLYTLATRRGIKSAWLAWLPIGNMWIIGSLADHYRFVAENRVTKYRKILLGFTIAVAAVSIIVVPIALYFLVMAFSYGFGGGYYVHSQNDRAHLAFVPFVDGTSGAWDHPCGIRIHKSP